MTCRTCLPKFHIHSILNENRDQHGHTSYYNEHCKWTRVWIWQIDEKFNVVVDPDGPYIFHLLADPIKFGLETVFALQYIYIKR